MPRRQPRFPRISVRIRFVLMLVGIALVFALFPYRDMLHLWHGTKGIDVSHHQGKIDWTGLKKSDVSFAYIKATEGGTYLDPEFSGNWKAARDEGLAVGAYHFFTQCKSGEEQAKNFLAHLPTDPDQLLPVLDAEQTDPCTDKGAPAQFDMAKEISAFLDKVEAGAGCRPIIYTDGDFDANYLQGKFSNEKSWLRSLVMPPSFRSERWIYWQYDDKGQRPGINTAVDLNVFRGSPGAFEDFKKSAGCFVKAA
jgi:lysozyme